MKRVLITGGAGFIGLYLAKYLANSTYDITIIDNLSRGEEDKTFKELVKKKNVKFIRADLTSEKYYPLLRERYDQIYHLAAINGTINFYKRPFEVLKVNILSLIKLFEWLTPANCGKFLFSSSSETYAGTIKCSLDQRSLVPSGEQLPLTIDDIFNPRNSYAGSKIIGEMLTINYCKKWGIPFNIVRYHNIYGPRMGYDHVIPEFLKRAYQREVPFRIYGSEATRAFCFVSDAVKATRMVMENTKCNDRVLNIGNDQEEIEIGELARRILELSGHKASLECHNSPEGSVKYRCPDLSNLRNITAYKPGVTLEEGLKKTHRWYLERFNEFNQ